MSDRRRFTLSCALSFVLSWTICLLFVNAAFGQSGSCDQPTATSYLDVNNVRALVVNTGEFFRRSGAGNESVYEVPQGSGLSPMFTAGLWVGGQINGESTVIETRYLYGPELWAGPIDDEGNPPSDCSPFDRIWNVSRAEIQGFESGEAPALDLVSWPTGLGAPTLAPAFDDGSDNDGDGTADEPGEMKEIHGEILDLPFAQRVNRVIDLAAGERPLMLGDQMLWWVNNDLGNEVTGTPIGLEVHNLAFAFDTDDHLGNATFYKATLFLKGDVALESAYVGMFADPDIGDYEDDFVGSDTTRNLGFAYNADDMDSTGRGYGAGPPAVGYVLLQGPVVPSPNDVAQVKNLGMTSFSYAGRGDYVGTNEPGVSDAYNFLRGRRAKGDSVHAYGNGIGPDGDPTRFVFPGDPVTRSFWSEMNVDGQGTRTTAPRDARFVLSSGPFVLQPGEVQEVVYGLVWARGDDHLDSISELRDASDEAQALANVGFAYEPGKSDIAPGADRDEFHTTAFPNPVTDALTIGGVARQGRLVEVSIHDLLGRVVARETHAGDGEIRVDMGGLSAGRYFVRLRTALGTATHLVVKS